MKLSSSWKSKLTAAVISCLFVLVGILAGEVYCRLFTRINFLDNSKGLFAERRFGTTYGNTPNFTGISFGETFYTDSDGFRVAPGSPAPNDGGDAVLVMGDSVAFGPALTEDATLAADLRRAMPGTTVLNAAVIGYDTFDYRNATSAIVSRHPQIKTVVLIFCLNDLNDASAQQIRAQTGQPLVESNEARSIPRVVNDYLRSRSKLFLWLKSALIDTQMVYFKYDLAAGYEKGDANLEAGLRPLVELDRELKGKGVTLRVFLSPYEAQVRPGSPDDFLEPQHLLTRSMTSNNIENYDMTPTFLARRPNTRELFLYGDPMHLSAEGTKLVAEQVCAKVAGCAMTR